MLKWWFLEVPVIKKGVKIKTILLSFFLISQLFGDASNYDESISCSEITKEIALLEIEKENETIATRIMFFIGAYVFGGTDKTLDEKIQVLKLKLLHCQEIQRDSEVE